MRFHSGLRLASCLYGLVFGVAMLPAATPLERAEVMTPVPADQPIPVTDFFRPSYFRHAQLNSAGTHIAAINPDKNDTYNFIIYDLATKKSTGTRFGDRYDIYDISWLGDSRLLFRISGKGGYENALMTVDIESPHRLVTLDRNAHDFPIGIPRKDPLKPIVWLQWEAFSHKEGGVVQFDALRNDEDPVAKPVIKTFPVPKGGDPISYFCGGDGELSYTITLKNDLSTLHRLTPDGWQPCPVNLDDLTIIGAGDHPGELIVLASDEPAPGRPRVLRRLNSATGQLGDVLYRDENYDPFPVSLYRSAADGHILGLIFERKQEASVWLDPLYANLQSELNRALPNATVRIAGSDRAENQFLVYVYSAQQPGRYYLCQRSPAQLTLLVDTKPWLDPQRQAPMQFMTYKSRDGSQLEGYYTPPVSHSASSPPLVVLPHDFAWNRDFWGWENEVQFLASRGYAVFQPNYRGSSGNVWRFPEEDSWNIKKMHDDVTDGVRALIKSGLADHDRIAIMGTGTGGFLALCGAAYEGPLYRCAVTITGAFDFGQNLRDKRKEGNTPIHNGLLRSHRRDPKIRQEHIDKINPLRATDKIVIPVFVAHGAKGRTADESLLLVRSLKKREIPYEVMYKENEDPLHGFAKLENQVELYTRIEAFLSRYLAPHAAVRSPAP